MIPALSLGPGPASFGCVSDLSSGSRRQFASAWFAAPAISPGSAGESSNRRIYGVPLGGEFSQDFIGVGHKRDIIDKPRVGVKWSRLKKYLSSASQSGQPAGR